MADKKNFWQYILQTHRGILLVMVLLCIFWAKMYFFPEDLYEGNRHQPWVSTLGLAAPLIINAIIAVALFIDWRLYLKRP